MDKMKRTSDSNYPADSPSKKSKSNSENSDKQRPSITRMENLSNEIFYEIFDYLDIFKVYEIFPDLNDRFHRLVTQSSYLLKIKLTSNSETVLNDRCRNIIIPNSHRILSLHLSDSTLIKKFVGQCIINKSFICLQSIVLNRISAYQLLKLLFYLHSLPNLFSLSICLDGDLNEYLNDIYQMLFHLSTLKYLQLSFFWDFEIAFSIPVATNEQFSSIKHLSIKHSCTIDALMSILYHTPQLSYLTCTDLVESDSDNNKNIFTIQLVNLTHISIHHCSIEIDKFEAFLKNTCCALQVLHFKLYYDEQSYFDANRWKKFIGDHMPQLYKIQFQHRQWVTCSEDDIGFDTLIRQFIQPFWNEQGRTVEVIIDDDYINYSIYQSRHVNDITYGNLSTLTSSTVPVTITNEYSHEWEQSFFDKIKRIFSDIPSIDLHIHSKNLSMHVLLNILQILPNIDSLTVSSFPSIQTENADIRSLVANNNKITKIVIEQILSFAQIQYLFHLCPYLQRFHISCPNDNNMMQFIRFILTKGKIDNPTFCFLRLYIRGINKKMTHPIQFMIESENLLTNYTIKHIPDHITFEWKQ